MRNGYFDLLKGVAILFVIGIHTYPIAHIDCVNLIIRQFIVLAVPLFCVISGFFVGNKNSNECRQFVKSHALPLYIPALFWSIPYIAYDFYKDFGSFSTNLIYLFILGYSRHYFISIMLQFYLLLPFLVKINSKKQLYIYILVSLMSISFFSYKMYVEGIELPLIIYAGFIPVWVMFFSLGIYLAKQKREYKLFPYIILSVIFFVLSYYETQFYINEINQINGIGYKVSNFLFSFFLIIVLMSKKVERTLNASSNVIFDALKWCGRNSLGIFFLHSPILLFVFSHFKVGWLLEFVLSSFLSVLIILVSKRVLNKNLLIYLGFR